MKSRHRRTHHKSIFISYNLAGRKCTQGEGLYGKPILPNYDAKGFMYSLHVVRIFCILDVSFKQGLLRIWREQLPFKVVLSPSDKCKET